MRAPAESFIPVVLFVRSQRLAPAEAIARVAVRRVVCIAPGGEDLLHGQEGPAP